MGCLLTALFVASVQDVTSSTKEAFAKTAAGICFVEGINQAGWQLNINWHKR
jgi:hypothetical protein